MRIIYLLPTHDNKPSGGLKVIYQHVEILNRMGIRAYVHHIYKPKFYCTWFESKAENKQSATFEPSKDFLIIPEVIAGDIGSFCLKNNIKYGIFVQNGYLIQKGRSKNKKCDLSKIYDNSEIILIISKEVEKTVKFVFPLCSQKKIIYSRPFINDKSNNTKKSLLISFMSRKLKDHSKNILFLLKNKINKNWKFIDIDKNSEIETFNILNKSSIFLSFSDQEGLGLPPIEAALCNNFVIGYTGKAGDEYFKLPLFCKIEYGDITTFVSKIINLVNVIEHDLNYYKKSNFQKHKHSLLSFYSYTEVEKDLSKLVDLVRSTKYSKSRTKVRFISYPIFNFFN